MYLFLKWLHITMSITALGANMTYNLWIKIASEKPEMLPFALRIVRKVDRRLANPAYIILLLSGLGMVWVGPFNLSTPWLLTSLILYTAAFLMGIFVYAPTMRAQIALAESVGANSQEYKKVAKQAAALGSFLVLLVITIVALMVFKPTLW